MIIIENTITDKEIYNRSYSRTITYLSPFSEATKGEFLNRYQKELIRAWARVKAAEDLLEK